MPTTEDRARYGGFVAACARAAREGVGLWDEPLEPEVMARVRSLAPKGTDVLVAGCGTGRGVADLQAMGCEVWAFDADAGMVELCRRATGLAPERCWACDAEQLPGQLEGKRFELVLATGLVSGGLWLSPGGTAGLVGSLSDSGRLLMDFLDAGGDVGRVERFEYPLGPGLRVPGCCYWPSRRQVRRELSAWGLRVRLERLRHDPAEPLWLAEAWRVAP